MKTRYHYVRGVHMGAIRERRGEMHGRITQATWRIAEHERIKQARWEKHGRITQATWRNAEHGRFKQATWRIYVYALFAAGKNKNSLNRYRNVRGENTLY
jgi:hypothetical protein